MEVYTDCEANQKDQDALVWMGCFLRLVPSEFKRTRQQLKSLITIGRSEQIFFLVSGKTHILVDQPVGTGYSYAEDGKYFADIVSVRFWFNIT
jgi:predicted phosphoribosyltransferase